MAGGDALRYSTGRPTVRDSAAISGRRMKQRTPLAVTPATGARTCFNDRNVAPLVSAAVAISPRCRR